VLLVVAVFAWVGRLVRHAGADRHLVGGRGG
jgi:hypothetical protein